MGGARPDAIDRAERITMGSPFSRLSFIVDA